MKKFKIKKRKFKPNKIISKYDLNVMFINAELRPFNVTFEDIKNLPEQKINGEDWFTYYKFYTKSQEQVWNEYCNKMTRKHYMYHYIDKRTADKYLSFFRLYYGLNSYYLVNENKNNS